MLFADALADNGEYDYHAEERYCPTYKLSSKIGHQAVEAARRATRRGFDLGIKAARAMLLEFTDEQMYNDEYGEGEHDYYVSHWQFNQVGDGSPYLYSDHEVWGEAIRNDKDYEAATEGKDGLWVTLVGVHY